MKKLPAAIALFTCASGLAFAQGAMQERIAVIGTATVKEEPFVAQRRYIGRIVAQDSVGIVAQVGGEIREVCFKEGQAVRKGDVLYRLDDTLYAAAVKSAEAQIAQAKASLDYAKKTFDRTKALFDKKVASSDDLDSATSAYETAQAAQAAAQAALATARYNLEHATIKSPVDGKTSVNNYTVGNYVSLSSGPLTTVVSTDPVRLKFSISNRDIIELFGGAKTLMDDLVVTLETSDGKPFAAEGKLLFAENSANAQTDSVALYAEVPNADGALVPGSAVTVYARRRTESTLASIPITAVIRTTTGSMVWVVEKGTREVDGETKECFRSQPRVVETGASSGNMIFVKSGLKAGEVVISKGTHKVFPNGLVAPSQM